MHKERNSPYTETFRYRGNIYRILLEKVESQSVDFLHWVLGERE